MDQRYPHHLLNNEEPSVDLAGLTLAGFCLVCRLSGEVWPVHIVLSDRACHSLPDRLTPQRLLGSTGNISGHHTPNVCRAGVQYKVELLRGVPAHLECAPRFEAQSPTHRHPGRQQATTAQVLGSLSHPRKP